MAILPCLGATYVVVAVPRPTDLSHSSESEFHMAGLGQLLLNSAFIRLNFGIFALHVMTTAIFVAGPRLLSLHVAPARHGLVYLALIPAGLVALRLASRRGDRSGRPREAILLAGVFVILAIMAVALAGPAMPTLLSRWVGGFWSGPPPWAGSSWRSRSGGPCSPLDCPNSDRPAATGCHASRLETSRRTS
ncbi:MAG TPA: hypothetical protein VGB13_10900, partial [Candidatus Krumholzibacteria bacterium]